MIRITFDVPLRDREPLITELWEAGTAGIVEEPDRLLAFFDTGRDLTELSARWAGCNPRIENAAERDWVQEIKDEWEPIAVGERFFLTPEWRDDPVPEGRLRLTTYPGMACGTGLHPATQLCLTAMEKWIKPGDRVADIGTGTGILAAAAVLLDARTIVACDIDHQSTQIAQRNLRNSHVMLFTGSARSLQTGAFNVVVANLNAATLRTLTAELRRILKMPGGLIILSGLRAAEHANIAGATGLQLEASLYDSEWVCLILASTK